MHEGLEVTLHKALDGGKQSALRSGRFTERRKPPLSDWRLGVTHCPIWHCGGTKGLCPRKEMRLSRPASSVVMILSYSGRLQETQF